MQRCSVCGKICNYDYLVCSDHGGPKIDNWRLSFSCDQRKHIDLCVRYVDNFTHIDGVHDNFTMIAVFAKMMDEYYK